MVTYQHFKRQRELYMLPGTVTALWCTGSAHRSLSTFSTRYDGLSKRTVPSAKLSNLLEEQFGKLSEGIYPANYKMILHAEDNDWWYDIDYDITNMMFKSTNGYHYHEYGMEALSNGKIYVTFD